VDNVPKGGPMAYKSNTTPGMRKKTRGSDWQLRPFRVSFFWVVFSSNKMHCLSEMNEGSTAFHLGAGEKKRKRAG